MTWNSEGILCSGKALALLNFLTNNDVDICIVTEAEIPTSGHGDLNVEGYHTYLPHASDLLKSAKYRVVVLVRSALATAMKIRLNLMHAAVQSVWIQLDLQGTPRPGTCGPLGTRVLVCGLYREWSEVARERTALSKVREQLQVESAEVDNIVLAGNINLDTARRCDVRYRRRYLMLVRDSAVADSNMRYLETGITYRSHGQQVREDGKAREHKSVLDHICVTKDLVATVSVLSDTTTVHFPLLAAVSVYKESPSTKSIERRNFKQLDPPLSSERWKPGPGLTYTRSGTRTSSLRSSTRGLSTAWTLPPP
jgi:hypothetical protein